MIAPYNDPQIVVTVTVERGGFGVESAAPIARAILERYFNQHGRRRRHSRRAGRRDRADGSRQALTHHRPAPLAGRRPGSACRNSTAVLLAASVGLIAFSVFTLAIRRPQRDRGPPIYFVERQSLYAVVGIALMIAVSRFDYTRLRELRVSIYAVMVGSIAFVLLVGTAVRGSNRWIDLPFFQFEPSELAKVLLCVSLAAFVYERVRRPFGLRQTLGLLGLGLATGRARLPAARSRHRDRAGGDQR